MSNEFYDHLTAPATGSPLSSAIVRAEFAKIEQGFDKLPQLSTSAGKQLRVNGTGTAVEASDEANIQGGTIDGATIGAVTPAPGTFTTLAAGTALTAPTKAVDTNTTDVATTAFVAGQAGSASPNMDGSAATGTSLRYARQDHTHPSDTSRAPTASPTFTGTVSAPTIAASTGLTAPTKAVDTNTTDVATTAFVLGQAGSASPNMDGTAAAGSSPRYARQDHTHPTDTSRAPTANPTFTGTVTLAQDPASPLQAATKQYVDAVAVGIDTHTSCACATTANITLSGLQTLDGYTTIAGDRVLVKNQTTTSQNGIYDAAVGAWTRSTDADATGEIKQGSYVFVNNGTTLAKTGWTQQTSGTITIGTTPITWAQFSSSTTYTAGTGLTLAGSVFSVSTVPVANGGTGATTAATAPFALKGANSDITSLSGLTTALSVAQGGTGAATLASGSVLVGNGTGAVSAASAAQIVAAIGATAVQTAANGTIANDTTTNATMYPVWVTANSGDLPTKVSSTKLTFNPSTGALTATGGFVGNVTGSAASATTAATATNLAAGVAGAIHYQSGVGVSGFSAAGTAGQPLLSGGTGAPTFGTLAVASGGTGATSAAAAQTSLDVPSRAGSGASGTWGISITGSANSATTAGTAGNVTGTVAVGNGGTGAVTLTGLVKGNGTSAMTAATVRTDYAEPTTGLATGLLKNTTGTGAHSIAVAGTDYQAPIGTISGLAKGNGANALTAASAADIVAAIGATPVANAAAVSNGMYTNASSTDSAGTYHATVINSSNPIATLPSGDTGWEARGNGTGPAVMTFHRPGSHAAFFGLDTDNKWKVGGWSMGAVAYDVIHSGVLGTGLSFSGGLLNCTVTSPVASVNGQTGAVATGDLQTFTSAGAQTWTKPSGLPAHARVIVEAWGGGSSGSNTSTSNGGCGGTGGGYVRGEILASLLGATETVTVGAGGAARTTPNVPGLVGGNSSFGSWLTAYGGPAPSSSTVPSAGISGTGAIVAYQENGGAGGVPGAGGDGIGANNAGGGGGGSTTGSTVRVGGDSILGGDGGSGSTTGSSALPTNGVAPGGGGGGTHNATSTTSGAGAAGQVRVTVIW